MNPCNVVLISIDTLRSDHLSCYGYHRETTPNIDRIAEDGVIFKNAYSTAAWTPPAHASMLTGLYPSRHGVVDNRRLDKSIATVAEVLSQCGYHTAGFVNNSQVGEFVGLQKGHETFHEVWKGIKSNTMVERTARYLSRKTKELMGQSDHGAHKTNLLVKQWLNGNGSKPFYIFIHYIEPHNPLKAPYPFRYKYFKKENGKINKEKLELVAHNPLVCFTDNIELNDDEKEALIALYDGEINYLDKKIGELIEHFKKAKLYEKTLIIITADHGEHFGEHGLYSHVASLYEPILHIPMIMKFPESFDKKGEIDQLVQLVDIFPTIAKAIGLDDKLLPDVQGISLLETDNDIIKYHEYIVAEWEGRIPYFVLEKIENRDKYPIIERFKEPLVMIREGAYKYICSLNGKDELYNLENDQSEMNNLVGENREVRERMMQKLSQWQAVRIDSRYEEQSVIDEATKKNLESLGYM